MEIKLNHYENRRVSTCRKYTAFHFILPSTRNNTSHSDLCRLFVNFTPWPIAVLAVFFNPLPDDKFLDSSKLKEFADDSFKLDENGRKLSKRVEITVGKGEIALHEQFLFFPQCFQKACFPGASKGVMCGNGITKNCKIKPCKRKPLTVKRYSFLLFSLLYSTHWRLLSTPREGFFFFILINHQCWKWRNASIQHFPFISDIFYCFIHRFHNLSSASAFKLDSSHVCSFGKDS